MIGAEHPELRCTNVDIEGGAGPGAASVLAAELRAQFQAQRARRPPSTATVEIASLTRYDELFNVDLEPAPTVLAVPS